LPGCRCLSRRRAGSHRWRKRQNTAVDRMVAFQCQEMRPYRSPRRDFCMRALPGGSRSGDGMFFLPEQWPDYDKRRMTVTEIGQAGADSTGDALRIQWMRQECGSPTAEFPRFASRIHAVDRSAGQSTRNRSIARAVGAELPPLHQARRGVPRRSMGYLSTTSRTSES